MWYSIKNDFLFLSCCESDIYELFVVEIVVKELEMWKEKKTNERVHSCKFQFCLFLTVTGGDSGQIHYYWHIFKLKNHI